MLEDGAGQLARSVGSWQPGETSSHAHDIGRPGRDRPRATAQQERHQHAERYRADRRQRLQSKLSRNASRRAQWAVSPVSERSGHQPQDVRNSPGSPAARGPGSAAARAARGPDAPPVPAATQRAITSRWSEGRRGGHAAQLSLTLRRSKMQAVGKLNRCLRWCGFVAGNQRPGAGGNPRAAESRLLAAHALNDAVDQRQRQTSLTALVTTVLRPHHAATGPDRRAGA